MRYLLCTLAFLLTPAQATETGTNWSSYTEDGAAHVRHESAFVEVSGHFYLLGGRRVQPVDIYDPATGVWSTGAPPPIEIHHFQAVVHNGEILVMGALTGPYPGETPTTHVLVYNPQRDVWREGTEIPPGRRRGAAGVAAHDGKFYLVAGIRDGHRSGWVPWLDEFDPSSNTWRVLPDAPHARDHFHAVAIDGSIYAAGGRRSGAEKPVFAATVSEVDVFDLSTQTWRSLPPAANLPTPRAGTMAVELDGGLLVLGGESPEQKAAHAEAEWLDPNTGAWSRLSDMLTPRHGAQAIRVERGVLVAGGSGDRGGGPELISLDLLEYP